MGILTMLQRQYFSIKSWAYTVLNKILSGLLLKMENLILKSMQHYKGPWTANICLKRKGWMIPTSHLKLSTNYQDINIGIRTDIQTNGIKVGIKSWAFESWYENLVQWTFSKIYKGNPNDVSKQLEIQTHLDIACNQTKILVAGTNYIQLLCWPQGSRGNPQTTQEIATIIGCSQQIDSKTSLLRTTSTQLLEHGIV